MYPEVPWESFEATEEWHLWGQREGVVLQVRLVSLSLETEEEFSGLPFPLPGARVVLEH